jgi:hypothetical protein
MATKQPRFTTPKGTAKYPWLNKPDTKFNPDGDYKVTLVVPVEEADTIMQFLDEQMALSEAKAKKDNPGKKVKVADAPYKVDEDNGAVEVNFKLKAKVTMQSGDSFEQKPALFDAKGKPMTNVNVGGGSKVKVSYECVPFYTALIGAGISLRLRAVQVIDLVEFSGGADAGAYGFGEEDGFEAEDNSSPFEDTDGNQEDSSDF